MKHCTKCKRRKPLDDFNARRQSPDGRRPTCRECDREYYEQNKIKFGEIAHQRYHANIEANREKQRNYTAKPTSVAWRQRRWQKNRKRLLKYQKARKLKNPQQFAEYEARRRAKIKGATVIEKISRHEIYTAHGGCCHICKLPVPFRKMHLDHVIPLSKGGQHTRENLKPAHPFCNMSKKDKLL